VILPVIWGAETGSGVGILIYIAVFFVSVLIHELGHAMVMRIFREDPRIVLYWNGGLAISDGGGGSPWNISFRNRSRSQHEQILISFAGPAAGFLLAFLTLALLKALDVGITPSFDWLPVFSFEWAGSDLENNDYLQLALWAFFTINFYLNLLNLVPVYPLDGGQIARSLFLEANPWQGLKFSLIVSLVVAGIIALLFAQNRSMFGAIFFGSLALQNFQELQMMGTGGFGGGFGGGRRPW
jgi:Zn-dependent protease